MIRHSYRTGPLVASFFLLLTATPRDGSAGTDAADAATAFEAPGALPDGSVRLPNQWFLRPAGRQVPLGDFPVNIAVHPDGRYAAILHCGYGAHEVAVVDLEKEAVASRTPVEESFYGLLFTRDGRHLFCSGAGAETIHRFRFAGGNLTEPLAIPLRDVKKRGVPAGLALSDDGKTLYAANVWGHTLSIVDLAGPTVRSEIPLGGRPAVVATNRAPPAGGDEAAITKRAEALKDPTIASDPFPYACAADPKGRKLYVSLWAQARIAVVDLDRNVVAEQWAAEDHPCEMLLSRDSRRLFVANANRNTVSVLDTRDGRALETLRIELRADSPPGLTPHSLALSPDGRRLFVANANINAVAVFDIEKPGRSRSLGFIPAGWYPTSVRVTPDGRRLLVANGKGQAPKPIPHGPQPGREAPANLRQYIGSLLKGTLSLVDLPRSDDEFDAQMRRHTAEALRCQPAEAPADDRPDGHPVPRRPGDASPIRYVIYVIKENRTYDQVLGDLPQGKGDPSLCLFPEHVTPNHHKLAREFVLLDNFYVESEVSADGHEWSMGAHASDFVEKMWPLAYGHNGRGKFPYPSEGNFDIARPAGGYLWDRAREAGVTFRSYGEFVANGKTPRDPARAKVPGLKDRIDPGFRSFDMDYSDLDRADRFIAEFLRLEKEGAMPRLQIVRLPNDHTAGTSKGKLTPTAYVAQNDLALGRVVDAVSRSSLWPQTAIFVVEDDAQNGPDHVDAHRTVAFVISPWARRGTVDSTMYSTASMLRTMELILGLKPMTAFDAAARPMFRSFGAKADPTPYAAEAARVDLETRNPSTAWGSDLSERMDFAKEDAADDLQLNEVVWRSVRGPNHPMPPPIRAAYVRTEEGDEDGVDD